MATRFKILFRLPLCSIGFHVLPPRRMPHGPIVADCSCCGKTCYFYPLATYGLMYQPLEAAYTPLSLPH